MFVLPVLGGLVGLLVAAWIHQAENRRWFVQQDSEVTQEANLLSRTLTSSADRQQWLQFVQGLRKMNWGEVEILSDVALSDRARQSLVMTPTEWIEEPNRYYRISVRQPIKEATASSPSEWMIYSRRVRQPELPWVLRTMIFGSLGLACGTALVLILWQTTQATTKLRDSLQTIRSRVKRPVARAEFFGDVSRVAAHRSGGARVGRTVRSIASKRVYQSEWFGDIRCHFIGIARGNLGLLLGVAIDVCQSCGGQTAESRGTYPR